MQRWLCSVLANRPSTQEGNGSAIDQATSVQQRIQHGQNSALKAVLNTEHEQKSGLRALPSRGLSRSQCCGGAESRTHC